MDAVSLTRARWQLVMPEALYAELLSHLFPGDHDEHGAVVMAGMHVLPDGRVRLLARSVDLAVDGLDYVAGRRGYRMLRAEFIMSRIISCRDEQLVYLAVHNHGHGNDVSFSSDDIRSHERGYPALLDIAKGLPVGALVFATSAVAGDIWLPGNRRAQLEQLTVVGRRRKVLRPERDCSLRVHSAIYDRQVRLFGDAGQAVLRKARIAIIGLGGVGSLLASFLGHLGVGDFVLIDPDKLTPTNIPRVLGANHLAALTWLRGPSVPRWLRSLAARSSAAKVALAKRAILRANPRARVQAIRGDVLEPVNAAQLLTCDYMFLAADTMRARLLFNQIVHQYLIPGVQIGSKVTSSAESGEIDSVFSVVRPVTPDSGCLWCNGLINRARLQDESQGEEERKAQRYVDEPDIVAPSVITLNAVGAAHAANDFLFYMTGMTNPSASRDYLRFDPRTRQAWLDEPRADDHCPECGHGSRSRFARGDARALTTRSRPAA